ncbi:hypothetical protein BEI_2699 [Halomonas beimenensis]|uniref:Uncharacterized protein n=1 Tax=Halomonas beimenensis TaxID=475662 RepID=A0A291P9U3_9GAMM|nr:hypothetical protein BEI_2699 [Halomonas beimenensis]
MGPTATVVGPIIRCGSEDRLPQRRVRVSWWAQQDSNLRPRDYEIPLIHSSISQCLTNQSITETKHGRARPSSVYCMDALWTLCLQHSELQKKRLKIAQPAYSLYISHLS